MRKKYGDDYVEQKKAEERAANAQADNDGEDKFAKLKNYLIHQIDLLTEDEVEMVKFEYDANNKQLHFQVWKSQSAD